MTEPLMSPHGEETNRADVEQEWRLPHAYMAGSDGRCNRLDAVKGGGRGLRCGMPERFAMHQEVPVPLPGTAVVIDGWRGAVVCDSRATEFYTVSGDNRRERFTAGDPRVEVRDE